MNIQELLKNPKVLIGIAVAGVIALMTFFGGGVSQEAQFNGDNNTQSADRNLEINVNQDQTNSQKQ